MLQLAFGAILSFSEYIISILGFRAYFESEKVDPLINLRKFSSVFGRKNIKIVDYDLAIKSGDDIFELFCKTFKNKDDFREDMIRNANTVIEKNIGATIRQLSLIKTSL